MTQWIEDWFGSRYYSLLYKHRDCNEAKLFLDKLVVVLKIKPDSRILDCGCGKGRHSIYLSEKGFDVTGIDVSGQNIRESKASEKKNLTFFTHDMRNLFRINYYDVALSLFTSFGYYENDMENNKVIRTTAGAIKKNGLFILDFMNVEKETKMLCPQERTEIEGIDFKVTRSTRNNCITKEIAITDKDKEYLFHENVKTYKRANLENFFVKNNLEVVHLFGDYELSPFNETTSERLILVGKKK